jgi:hypothetical protein
MVWNVEEKMLEPILKDRMTGWAKSQAFKLGHAKFQLNTMKI